MSLSLIVAIFNRKEELLELLTSLTAQTDQSFEVIIVDDGSSVDLLPTIQGFNTQLNLKYLRKPNSGAGLSRNYGAQYAQYPWLIFVDSDVVLEKDYIQNIKNNILKQPADAFGGADKAHQGFNTLQKAISYSMTSLFTTGGIRGKQRAITKFQPRSFNMGVRKEAFHKVGGFSEMRIGEDPDLSMTLWEQGFQTIYYDDIGVYHKRRTNLKKFSKQVYQFGVARPILNQRHPNYTKITFWFPSLFLLGSLLAIGAAFGGAYYAYNREPSSLFLLPILLLNLYFTLIFLDSSVKHKSVKIGACSMLTSAIQLYSYGCGFLKSWVVINLLKQDPKTLFQTHFYSE